MRRTLTPRFWLAIMLGLTLASASAAPALAFWERSQWSRCSDAPTAAEWNRFRCWEIEPYNDGAGHRGLGGTRGGQLDELYPQGPMRRGGVVRRLG